MSGGQLFVAVLTAQSEDMTRDHVELVMDEPREDVEYALFCATGVICAAVEAIADISGRDPVEIQRKLLTHLGLFAAGVPDA